jgi:hypothetical protein
MSLKRIFKEFFPNVASFSPAKNAVQNTTISPAIHHNLTTIYHHKIRQNPQNPRKITLLPPQIFSSA